VDINSRSIVEEQFAVYDLRDILGQRSAMSFGDSFYYERYYLKG